MARTDSALGCAGMLTLGIAVSVAVTVLEGAVLAWMWNRFAVRLGAPEISTAVAVGIATMVGMLTHQHTGTGKSSEENVAQVATAFLRPVLCWVVAAITWEFVV